MIMIGVLWKNLEFDQKSSVLTLLAYGLDGLDCTGNIQLQVLFR
jgi:hypothetical protein